MDAGEARPAPPPGGRGEGVALREVWLTFRQTLVSYAGDKAGAVLVHTQLEEMDEERQYSEPRRIHVLEWSESGGKARGASITSFLVGHNSVRVVRYRPATNA